MTKSERKKKKEGIETLKVELEQNKKTFDANINLLNLKLKMEEASLKDYEFNKRAYNVKKEILDIELSHMGIATPLMEYHKEKKWLDKFKELKEFELTSVEKDWELQQSNYNTQIERLNKQINEEKIAEQQKHIEKRNPEIISSLKSLGVDTEKEEKSANDKHNNYIG